MGALPSVSKETITRVMDTFESGPCSPHWRKSAPASGTWGIRHGIGRFFPVKEVIRRAVYWEHGSWPDLSDSEQARQYVLDRGFTVAKAPFSHPPEGFEPGPRPKYTIVLRPDDGGWFAEIPALEACYTSGRTLEEAILYIQEVYDLVMGELEDEGRPFPPDLEVVTSATAPSRA